MPRVSLKLLCVAGLAVAFAASAHAASLTQYWPFDDGAGTSAANAVTGGNMATLVNLTPASTWIGDHPPQLTYSSKAISISEANGYVNLKNLRLKNSATVSLWINPANYDTGDMRLFSQVQFVNPFGGVVRFDPFVSGNLQANGGADWISIGALDQIPAGAWTHLAFVYDEGLLWLWINGVKQSGSANTGFVFDTADFGLGARFDLDGALGGPFGNGFVGSIDDVSIWDGAISTSSIAKLAGGTRPTAIVDTPDTPVSVPAKLTQYFPLEEAPGSTTAANAVAGGNEGQFLEGDPSSAWVRNDKPAKLGYSTTALSLDGVAAYLNVGNVQLKDEGTISLWVKPMASQPDTRLYSLTTLPSAFSGVTRLNSLDTGVVLKGSVLVYSGAWQMLGDGGTLQEGQWTHLAFAYAPGKVTLYVDGLPRNTVSSGLDFDQAELGLGARLSLQNGSGFNGLMDDVSIWDHALQPSSVRKLASGASPKDVIDSPATEPPTIFSQPAGATVMLGEPAALSVTVRGAPTLTYQWQKEGSAVTGATNNPLTIPAVALGDAGDYTVVVANAFGTATSQVAKLVVDPGVPVITTQPVNLTRRVGATATFNVAATGARPLSYQWYKGTTALSGATGTNYTTGVLTAADAGDYKVVVSNVSGSVTSAPATLALVSTPAAVNVNLVPATGSFVYEGTAGAPDPASVWNQITEPALAAAANREVSLVDSDGLTSPIRFTSGNFGDIQAAFSASNGGGNNMQRTYWHVGAGNVTAAFGFKNLDPKTKYDVYVYGIAADFGTGNTELFSLLGGESKPVNPLPDTGFAVVGQDYAVFPGITGVTEAMFTAGESGNPSVFSTVTGLQIIKSTEAPHLLKQPAGQFVRPGTSVTFSVELLGAAPFTYQWRKDGSAISGATSAAYTLSSVKVEDAGNYSVVVSNSAGSETSSPAALRVQTAPPAINVNLNTPGAPSEYIGTAAAPDVGTAWNQVTEDMLAADPNREVPLTDSDGTTASVKYFSGSFAALLNGYAANNGGGNALQASYWHVGAGKVSPEFGFRGLDQAKYYDVYVYGMQTDFGTGWGQAYTLVNGATKTIKELPDTGFPVEGEDYVVFKGITGVTEAKFTSGTAGGYFSTVTGLQIIQGQKLAPAQLSVRLSGNNVALVSWTGGGVLQQADQASGPWQNVANPSNPYPAPITGTAKFYRVAQ